MDSKQFLKDMLEGSEKWSGGGSGAGVIGRIKIEFGLHRYVAGHDFWSFWKPAGNAADMNRIGEELVGRLRQAGCSDKPVRGIKVTISKDVLSRDEPYKADLQEFIPEWQADSFTLLVDHINKAHLPFNEWFYGKVEYKANPYFVKQGEAGKKETDQNGNPRYPSIRIPVEKFANEQAARAAVGGNVSESSAVDDSQWSDTARSNYDDLKQLVDNAEEIVRFYTQILGGTAISGFNLPNPLTASTVKKQLAEIYSCETSDIDIALSIAEAPF